MPSVAISDCIKQGIDPETTYADKELIGDGSFGEVYKVLHTTPPLCHQHQHLKTPTPSNNDTDIDTNNSAKG
eukprot:Awhi_evm1s14008